MKKFIISLLVLTAVMPVCAQKYDFPIDEDGICTFSGTIENSRSQKDNYSAAKRWCNNQGFTSVMPVTDTPSESFSLNIAFIYSQKVNPFAGAFVEALIFELQVEAKDNALTYAFKNLQIQETYGGWGSSNKINPIQYKLEELEDAQKRLADAQNNPSLSKKERKDIVGDAEDDIDDVNKTLEKAYKEFKEKLDDFIKTIQ